MLPNAEGCGTGLQLSAKDVVRGRPDMMIPTIPTAVTLAWGGGGGGWGVGGWGSVASYTAGLVDSSPPNLLIQKAMTSEWEERYLQGGKAAWKSGDFISSPRVPFHPNQRAVITSTGGRSQHYFIPYLSQLLSFLPPHSSCLPSAGLCRHVSN